MSNKAVKTKPAVQAAANKKQSKPSAGARSKAKTARVKAKPESAAVSKTTMAQQRSFIMMPNAEQLNKTTQQAVEDMNCFARESWEVALKSASAVSKGMDETVRSVHNIAQENVTRAVSAGKTLLSAKTPREVMDLQAEFIKDSLDHFIASAGKISEISARLTKEAVEPVAQHTNNTLGKIWNKKAA